MRSLRTRLLAGVLLLAAAGLVLLAAVTYAEQRSFLLNRVDSEVRSAVAPLSRALDDAGFRPSPALGGGLPGTGGDGGRFGPGGGGGAPGGPAVNLPPGTYGQRRDASGKVLGA